MWLLSDLTIINEIDNVRVGPYQTNYTVANFIVHKLNPLNLRSGFYLFLGIWDTTTTTIKSIFWMWHWFFIWFIKSTLP